MINEEETSFFKTLGNGIQRFEKHLSTENELVDTKNKIVSGKLAFDLMDTFGFPIDLTELMAREKGFSVDSDGFTALMKEQKDRSRSATAIETDDWIQLIEDNVEEFVGYDNLTAKVKIVKYRRVSQKKKSFFQVVFNLTPFYPEGGGQVGDTGYLEFDDQKVSVFDTKKENN